ncbi:MAG: energy transducer TonB [Saprospiraceae bacterium]
MKIVIVLLLFGFNITLQAQSEEKPFTYVEKMPSFPGGTDSMYIYLYRNIHYPADARKYKITGQVITQFTVSPEGEIQDIKIVRGIGYGCNEEAERIIASMNDGHKWIPGLHNGKPVPVTFTLPIKFTMQGD